MTETMIELLQRLTGALEHLEARLRALELIIASGNHRFVGLAVDEVDLAAQHVASLELSRVMAWSAAGFAPDISAAQLVAGLGSHHPQAIATIAELTDSWARTEAARDRATPRQ